MWIWLFIATITYGAGFQTDDWRIKSILIILTVAAFNYWDNSRNCNHCKRKAHK